MNDSLKNGDVRNGPKTVDFLQEIFVRKSEPNFKFPALFGTKICTTQEKNAPETSRVETALCSSIVVRCTTIPWREGRRNDRESIYPLDGAAGKLNPVVVLHTHNICV